MQKKKRKIWPLIILLLVFLVSAACGALFVDVFNDDSGKRVKDDTMLVAADKATVMIMGVDSREDDVGRSDTLMVATIDPQQKQAALLSIPRDTRVKIKGYGWDKINAAYAYGNVGLSRQTVEQFLGVPIDHYIVINVEGFQKIIDAIGGVDIDVEKRMRYDDPWDDNGGLHINLYPGKQHMDGKTAVTYVRYRDEEGDIGRIGRQQKFMRAVMDEILSPAIIPRIPSIISEVFDTVKTDMSIRQLLAFFGSLREAQRNGLKTDMVPGTPLYIDDISYWIPDITQLRTTLAYTLDVKMTPSMRTAMERTASEYKNSVPASAREVPSDDPSIGRMPTANTKNQSTDSKKATDNKTTGKKPDKQPANSVSKDELKEPSAGRSAMDGKPPEQTNSQSQSGTAPSRDDQASGKN